MQLCASSLLVVQGEEEKRQKMLGTVTAALLVGNFFFNLKCEGTGWRQTRRHTHTHTHTHREKHIFVLLSIWGCLPVTADSGAARGCRGAAWLAVIGLGVKWRTAEALAETWGQGEEDCDSAIRLLCTQRSW